MDNCDLDTLAMSEGKLNPSFRSDITQYTATVESSVETTTLHLQTSDCGASCNILFGDGSKTIKLEDGLNKVEIEVVSEDGTTKMYSIAVTKLSASAAQLSDLTVQGGHSLQPDFSPTTYDYSCPVHFDCCEVRMNPQTPDKSMQTAVNDATCSESIMLNAGETEVIIKVTSADGANSQVYTVNITREQIPLAVTFCDVRDQIEFECPVSLSALDKPVSIHQSEPKTVLSAPYIDMLTRRSKVDPFTERPLGEGWKVRESELEQRMSNAPVKCFFSHRGCRKQMRYAEIGAHAKECRHKPSSDLDPLEVTQTNWYRKYFASSNKLDITTNHTLEDSSSVVSDEKCWLSRALLKYLDAWSLNADSWEYNLQAGRLLLLQGRSKEALQHLQTALGLQPCHPTIRFYTGLAQLQQKEETMSNEQVMLFIQQGLEYGMGQFFVPHDHKEQEQWDTGCHLSVVNAQFLRGCLSLAALLSKYSSSDQAMSPEQVYHIISGLAAQGISRCVNAGEVVQQLEWVLLDAHFALLQTLIQQDREGNQPWIVKRCQALTALILLSSITPCRELLDMQEKVCQMGVVAAPRCSRALCLLGSAQLAQSDAATERGQAALANACLSFQASIELEGSHQTGEPPEQLHKQTWWKDHVAAERDKTVKHEATETKPTVESSEATVDGKKTGRVAPARGAPPSTAKTLAPTQVNKTATGAKQTPQAARGRKVGLLSAKSNGVGKAPGKTSIKAQTSCKSGQEHKPSTSAVEVGKQDNEGTVLTALNEKSYLPRLGLARALTRTADSQKQACNLYREVIDMAPEVHDAHIELANLLFKDDPLAAVDIYSRFPLKPVCEQTFDDAFITGEVVHILMKQEQYEHPQLLPNLIAYGKVMGLCCLEKYIEALEGKFMTNLLRTVYAGILDKSVDDEELQDFFKFKCWI